MEEADASIRRVGVEIRRSAPGTITLRAVPACLAGIAPDALLGAVADWVKASDQGSDLVSALAALAGSSPVANDIDDIVDAAVGGRLDVAVAAVDEATLRNMFTNATRR